MKNSYWENEEIEFLKNNYQDMTHAELATCLGRTKTAVDLKLNRLNLKKTKYCYNVDFFKDIDNQDKAYWLGFIFADGYIVYKDTLPVCYEFCIELQQSDYMHLKKFNTAIQGNLQIVYRSRPSYFDNTKIHRSALIRIYNKRFVSNLMTHGVVQNKSLIKRFPVISDDLLPHFIRGYYDGNGCVCKDDLRKKLFQCNFTCGSLDFVSKLREKLFQNNIYSYIIHEQEYSYRLYIKGIENCTRFLQYIYTDAHCMLDKKYNRALQLFEEFNYEHRLPLHSETSGFLK